MKKGRQNQRLSEIVNSFKNQLIIDQIFEQTFRVQLLTNVKSFEYTVSTEPLTRLATCVVLIRARQVDRGRVLP